MKFAKWSFTKSKQFWQKSFARKKSLPEKKVLPEKKSFAKKHIEFHPSPKMEFRQIKKVLAKKKQVEKGNHKLVC